MIVSFISYSLLMDDGGIDCFNTDTCRGKDADDPDNDEMKQA